MKNERIDRTGSAIRGVKDELLTVRTSITDREVRNGRLKKHWELVYVGYSHGLKQWATAEN